MAPLCPMWPRPDAVWFETLTACRVPKPSSTWPPIRAQRGDAEGGHAGRGDGRGQGRRLRARAAARRLGPALAGGASWLGTAIIDEALALRAAGIAGAGCWPGCGRRARPTPCARRWPPTSTCRCRSLGQLEVVRRRRRGSRAPRPASTSRSTPGCPATACYRRRLARPARAPRRKAQAAEARSRSSASGATSSTPTSPATRPSAAQIAAFHDALDVAAPAGVEPPAAAPGQLGGHADPARGALRPRPARRRRLRAVAGAAAGRLRAGARR